MHTIPAETARFRPVADRAIFSRLIQDAWEAKNAALEDAFEKARIGEIAADHLEARYPASDMAVLARYNVASECDRVTVRMHNAATDSWDRTFSIPLPRKVFTPGQYSGSEIYCGGPRYSEMADYGLTEKYRKSITAEELAEINAYNKANEDARLPRECEPYFTTLVEARTAYQAEYGVAANWPSKVKAETGVYPTWREIETAFPVVGAHIAALRSAA